MKAVGVKVLKDNLSKYLAMVAQGETILVTDRDEVVPPSVTRWQAFLNQEERRGAVRLAAPGPPLPIDELRRLPRPRVKVDLAKMLDELRTD